MTRVTSSRSDESKLHHTPTPESAKDDDEGAAESRFQFGRAGGALQYGGGRSEQALGAVLRGRCHQQGLKTNGTSRLDAHERVTVQSLLIERSSVSVLIWLLPFVSVAAMPVAIASKSEMISCLVFNTCPSRRVMAT